ncbi:alpha-taxilin-like [Lolium rigidum]|uniref:alpha-taxilin-like n=1 Tax=Lolium rigidum TaxID=89674 RepID=UPI001F5DFACE|nr:alpha-taxilin-like [Lolium rigidum]
MEASPATRLPEADALPDGFVESSSADQAPPTSSAPAPAAAGSPHPALGPDHEAATADNGSETLGALSSSSTAADTLRGLDLNVAWEPETDPGQQGPAADIGEAKDSMKESFVVEQAEPLAIQKESVEPKRKAVKKGSKLEKDRELLELAQRYHRVVAERDAAIAVKEKLESLCREFQRQNKMLKEECQRVSTQGQNFRTDMSDKFENAMKAVGVKLEEQKNECIAQFEENNSLRNKLKELADQYNIIQQKYAHQLKEKTLELELADLKVKQHQAKAAQEHAQMVLYAEQVSQLVSTEKTLRVQLAADGEKFQQFQDALSKSNETFESYRREMEQMVKVIKGFRKQNAALKSKCENSDVALVKLIEEREVMKKQLDKYKNQKEKLESLCRSLQAERKQSPSLNTPDATTSDQADLTANQESANQESEMSEA